MRRHSFSRAFLIGFERRCVSDSILDEIFSELIACDITQTGARASKQAKMLLKQTSCGDFTRAPVDSVAAVEADIRVELSKEEHLQRLTQEARDQAAMIETEKEKKEEVRRHAKYVASPPAVMHLSGAELIQEKSLQHFVPADDSSARLSVLPHLDTPGTVAVVTLVAKVLTEAQMCGEESSDTSVTESGPYAHFLVEYNVPFLPSSTPVAVEVRCYGATLASFARQHVGIGDLVHVLGHLLPLELKTADSPTFCVCALPVGGNISVVLAAAHEATS